MRYATGFGCRIGQHLVDRAGRARGMARCVRALEVGTNIAFAAFACCLVEWKFGLQIGAHAPLAAALAVVAAALLVSQALAYRGRCPLAQQANSSGSVRAAVAAAAAIATGVAICLLALRFPAALAVPFAAAASFGIGLGTFAVRTGVEVGLRRALPHGRSATRLATVTATGPAAVLRGELAAGSSRLGMRPSRRIADASKCTLDRLFAVLLLVMLAPVLLCVAVLIRLDTPGPVLFRQQRVGYANRLFGIYKFRTMQHAHADLLATRQTFRGDHRVTRVGRVLRELSLDELPQLFNVIRGDMSLVGPRPHAPGTSVNGRPLDALLENYPARHMVKPGITGLAQVRGFRGALHTMDELTYRLDADLEYIRRRSLWLDFKIMLMTLLREVRSRSAY